MNEPLFEFANFFARRLFDVIYTRLLRQPEKSQFFAVKVHHFGEVFAAQGSESEANDFEVLLGRAVRAPFDELVNVARPDHHRVHLGAGNVFFVTARDQAGELLRKHVELHDHFVMKGVEAENVHLLEA